MRIDPARLDKRPGQRARDGAQRDPEGAGDLTISKPLCSQPETCAIAVWQGLDHGPKARVSLVGDQLCLRVF